MSDPLTQRKAEILHALRLPCPAPGCKATVSADVFLCRKHWGMVPGRLQVKIYATWGQRKHNPRDVEAVAAHEAAKAEALAAIGGVR